MLHVFKQYFYVPVLHISCTFERLGCKKIEHFVYLIPKSEHFSLDCSLQLRTNLTDLISK